MKRPIARPKPASRRLRKIAAWARRAARSRRWSPRPRGLRAAYWWISPAQARRLARRTK